MFSGYELEYFQSFGLWFTEPGIKENLGIFKVEQWSQMCRNNIDEFKTGTSGWILD